MSYLLSVSLHHFCKVPHEIWHDELSRGVFTGWVKKLDHFKKFITPVNDGVKRYYIYQYVQLLCRLLLC